MICPNNDHHAISIRCPQRKLLLSPECLYITMPITSLEKLFIKKSFETWIEIKGTLSEDYWMEYFHDEGIKSFKSFLIRYVIDFYFCEGSKKKYFLDKNLLPIKSLFLQKFKKVEKIDNHRLHYLYISRHYWCNIE